MTRAGLEAAADRSATAMETPAPGGAAQVVLLLTPVVLSALVMAAHFLRAGLPGVAALALLSPLLLLLRRRWAVDALRALLLLAAFEWVRTLHGIAEVRVAMGQPWLRMAVILGGVAAVAIAGAAALGARPVRARTDRQPQARAVSTGAFLVTLALLVPVQLVAERRMLLLDRFVPGAGWLEALALAVYAGLVAEKLLQPAAVPRTRGRIWLLFSVVFFAQLVVGLAGAERFLMSGELHLPVPALIIAAPIFRGGGFFMLFLFAATLLVVGPAWCSHLCYIGAWDNLAASRRRRPGRLPRWSRHARVAIAAAVVAAAALLRLLGVPTAYAAGLAAAFGLAGVAVMVLWSRRTGQMAHCTVFCPVGLAAVWLGKLSPFRMRIRSHCNECGACTLSCRYGALAKEDILRRRPGLSCTLCGDCLSRCRTRCIEYRFAGLSATRARTLFVALVAGLHAVFLGVARL